MTTVHDVNLFMNEFAPGDLAEDWDNVGLLVGDPDFQVQRLMTCLTITPESAEEAVRESADVIVAHHPLPFRPLKRLTTEQVSSRLLLQLIKSDIAIISPHTAFDSAAEGINHLLAERFQLHEVVPLLPSPKFEDCGLGAARMGVTASGTTMQDLIDRAKSVFGMTQVRFVGASEHEVSRVALCCGSGGSFLGKAMSLGCDALITGEATFHSCLEAKANSIGMVLLGHHTSERFAVEQLAGVLQAKFADLHVWSSQDETDPIRVG